MGEHQHGVERGTRNVRFEDSLRLYRGILISHMGVWLFSFYIYIFQRVIPKAYEGMW